RPKMNWSSQLYRKLNGVLCIYKPPHVSPRQCVNALCSKLCDSLNDGPPDLRSLSQVAGPAFVPARVPLHSGRPLSDWCSGVQLVGLGRRGIIACELLSAGIRNNTRPPTPHWQPKAAAFTAPPVYAMRLVAWDPPGFELEFHVPARDARLPARAGCPTSAPITELLPKAECEAVVGDEELPEAVLTAAETPAPSNKKQRRKKSRAAVETNFISMATASPVATAAAAVAPAPTEALLSISTIKNHRRQFYGSESRLKRIRKFCPSSQCRQSGKMRPAVPGEKFFTASVSSIDREFAPKPPFRLPPSWIPIDHTSGLTMYLHKPTKVVTLARSAKCCVAEDSPLLPLLPPPPPKTLTPRKAKSLRRRTGNDSDDADKDKKKKNDGSSVNNGIQLPQVLPPQASAAVAAQPKTPRAIVASNARRRSLLLLLLRQLHRLCCQQQQQKQQQHRLAIRSNHLRLHSRILPTPSRPGVRDTLTANLILVNSDTGRRERLINP
uniref:DUF4708 domain-containing protein n=1 Tax=Macrostomum lignano TaxID=282301 RepID=A0A1I8F6E5_9PLAT